MSPRLLLRLLRVVSWPHWRGHPTRTALTVVGVALGVATIVAIGDVSHSVLRAFQTATATVAGDADLEVTADAATVPESAVDAVGAVPGVAVAAGLVEGFLPLVDHPDEVVYVVGVDFLGSSAWETQLPRTKIDVPDTLEFVARSDSVVVSQTLATRLGLGLDAPLAVVAPAGPQTLVVRGFLGDVPPARLFDGAVLLMDLPAAQRLLGRADRVDRIAVRLAGGRAAELRATIARAAGPGTTVAEPESRGEQAERLLFSLRSMLVVAASLAVIVGALIVFQAVSVSIQQRRRQLALLNAVGIERRSLTALALLETGTLAALGVAIGVYGGIALAGTAVSAVGAATSEIWTRVDGAVALHSTAGVGIAAAVGLVMALLAAWLALRVTFAAPTVEALRPVAIPLERVPRARRALLLAAACAASTWLITFVPPRWRWGVVAVIILSQLVAYVGAAIASPVLVQGAGAALRRLTRRTSRLPLRLATDALPRAPRRAGMTVAAISAALAMAASVAGFVQSFEDAWLVWLQQHFAGDLFVGAGARVHLLAGPPMAESIGTSLAQIAGVRRVAAFRVLPTRLGDAPVFLQSVPVEPPGLPMVEGSWPDAVDRLEHGRDEVLLSDNVAFRLGLHRDDRISLDTPAGPRRFRVAGTFVDYLGSLDLGSVAVSPGQLRDVWGDSAANLYRIWLEPGADAGTVRRRIVAGLGNGYYVITARQFLDSVHAVWQQFFVAAWALELIATLVSAIGLVNAQLASILDRTTEISMLRTIGVSSKDVTRAVVVECATLGAVGATLGLALGAMLSWQFVTVSMRLLTGWRIGFVLPVAPLLGGACLAAALSAIAGAIPARVAARVQARQASVD